MKPEGSTLVKSNHLNVLSYTHVQLNGLDAVALVLEAIPASSTGNFETLGSKFSNETRFCETACVLCHILEIPFLTSIRLPSYDDKQKGISQ